MREVEHPGLNNRMEVLETVANTHTKRVQEEENADLLEIHHLFYDEIQRNPYLVSNLLNNSIQILRGMLKLSKQNLYILHSHSLARLT